MIAALARALSRVTRAETDVEDLKTVAIFCGAGLLLSLLRPWPSASRLARSRSEGRQPNEVAVNSRTMQTLPPASHVPPAGFLRPSAFVERSTLRSISSSPRGTSACPFSRRSALAGHCSLRARIAREPSSILLSPFAAWA